MVTEQANPPVELEKQLDVAETSSSVNEIGREGLNPPPVAVIALPTIPRVGRTESDEVTVNVAGALLTPSEAPSV
jgi:hypothetical protein